MTKRPRDRENTEEEEERGTHSLATQSDPVFVLRELSTVISRRDVDLYVWGLQHWDCGDGVAMRKGEKMSFKFEWLRNDCIERGQHNRRKLCSLLASIQYISIDLIAFIFANDLYPHNVLILYVLLFSYVFCLILTWLILIQTLHQNQ